MSIPFQTTPTPFIKIWNRQINQEQRHGNKSKCTECIGRNSPRVQEHKFNIKNYEHHGGEVLLHRKASTTHWLWGWFNSTFVGGVFRSVIAFRPGEGCNHNRKDRKAKCENSQHQNRRVNVHSCPSRSRILFKIFVPICALVKKFTTPPSIVFRSMGQDPGGSPQFRR